MKLLPIFLTAVLLPAGSALATLPGLSFNGTSFTYDAPDGQVTGIFVKPAGPGPFPAVLINHGKGGSAAGFSLPHANILVQWGFVCIGPNYTHVETTLPPEEEGYCPENSRRARRCLDILADTTGVDMTRVAAFGHSMGSFLIGGLCGEIPGQIKAACISAGGTSGTTNTGFASPATQEVQGITAPFLMFHGTADTTVFPSQSVSLQTLLSGNGVPNKRLLYDSIGHDIINSNVKRTDIHAIMRAWFTQHGVLAFTGNTAPALSAASSVTVTAGSASAPFAVTLSDAETALGSLTLSAFTTHDTRLPNSAITLGGSGANRTLTFTPPAGQIGTVEVALVVNDGQLSAAHYLQVTVQAGAPSAVNHRPGISWIADQRAEPGATIPALAFTVDDAETAAASLSVSASSSNTTLLPNGGITFGGSGANRTISLAPTGGQTGTATVMLTVSDGTKTSATAFTLTVAATIGGNTPPVIQNIANEILTLNSAYGSLPLVIKDTESAETALTLSATSSNTTLVPSGNVVFGGQNYGRTVTVTPAANQSGRATITLTVSDGSNTASTAFVLDVISANTAPAITGLPSYHAVSVNTSHSALAFTAGDAETAAEELRVTATSSNTALVPNSGIALGGSGGSRTVTVTPSGSVTGVATITLAVSDGDIIRRAQFLYFRHDPAAPSAQFSRPRGLFVLDGAGPTNYTTTFGKVISLRDTGIRNLPFIDGYTLRVAWDDVEGAEGQYDFFIIANALSKLPAGQKLSLIIVPGDPAYIAATPGVDTWSDAGTLRAKPWDLYLRTRRRALLAAMSAHTVGGVPLGRHPRLDMLDPYLPGGFTGIRDPNSTQLRNISGYTRAGFLAAVQDELRSLQDCFPGKFIQIGFWPIIDNENASYGGVTAWEWMRQQLLAEFNGATRPRIGFFMENLAARRSGASVDPFTATPVTGFASALFASQNAAWNGFQMLGSWTRPFNDGHVNNTLNGTPADALEYAFNTYRAEYHEVYSGDVDSPLMQPALQRWHDLYASRLTTDPASDEDGDGLPLWWEEAHELPGTLDSALADNDNDNLPNLLEFAFNQNPAIDSSTALPATSRALNPGDGQTYLTCTYLRRTDAPWLTYTVEASDDLSTWDSGPALIQEVSVTPAGDGVCERVTVRVLPALGSGPNKKFVRVSVRP